MIEIPKTPQFRRVRSHDGLRGCKMCGAPPHWEGIGRVDPWCKACVEKHFAFPADLFIDTHKVDEVFAQLLDALGGHTLKVRDLWVKAGFIAWNVTVWWQDGAWRIEDFTSGAYYVAPCQVSMCTSEQLVERVKAAVEAHMPKRVEVSK